MKAYFRIILMALAIFGASILYGCGNGDDSGYSANDNKLEMDNATAEMHKDIKKKSFGVHVREGEIVEKAVRDGESKKGKRHKPEDQMTVQELNGFMNKWGEKQ